MARRRAAGRAGRVHAARVPERPDRSGAGRGGGRPHRRGHAAAGARGVRSARGHADGARSRAIDAALFDLTRALEASLDFPDEGYHFVDAGEARAARSRAYRVGIDDAARRTRARGRLIREGAQVAIVGRPNAGQVEPVQPARRRGSRDRDRRARHDARSADRDASTSSGMPLTIVDTAGVRGGAADAIEAEGIARARRRAASPTLSLVVLDRSRPLTDDDRALLAATARSRGSSWRTSPICRRRGMPRRSRRGAVAIVRADRRGSRRACARRSRRRSRATSHCAIAPADHERAPRGSAAQARAALERARRRPPRRARRRNSSLADLHEARGAARGDHGRAHAGRRAARRSSSSSVYGK